MKLTNLYLMIVATVMSASAMANAFELPANVVAEVSISGGFMAPGAINTTTYAIETNGNVTKTLYHAGDFGPGSTITTVVGHLGEKQMRKLVEEIAHVSPGELVDVDPNGPTGADFPTESYYVNTGTATIEIASRRGDAHLFMLEQASARVLKNDLDKVIQDSNQ